MRAVSVHATIGVVVLALIAGACTEPPTRATAPAPDAAPSGVLVPDRPEKLKEWLRTLVAADANAAVLAGAGDIAECYQGSVPPPINGSSNAKQSAAEETAKLLDRIPGTVMAVGDNAYQFGTPFDYAECYHPTWGRHFDRTRPAAGNHEYMTPGAAGYFAYFRERAVPPPDPSDLRPPPGNGYYSYDAGGWHVIVLNSTPQVYLCWAPEATEVLPDFQTIPPPGDPKTIGETCPGDGPQQLWLEADLAWHIQTRCTVVYFHHPRFSSGRHGNHFQMQRIWRMLYNAGVDVVITGHDHHYERFAPQDADGNAWATGIRQFVVGTGGADLRPVGLARAANSEVVIDDTHGVIALGLRDGAYDWAFIGVDRAVRDSGSGHCHDPPQLPIPEPPIVQ
jgi:hypothetical protein